MKASLTFQSTRRSFWKLYNFVCWLLSSSSTLLYIQWVQLFLGAIEQICNDQIEPVNKIYTIKSTWDVRPTSHSAIFNKIY